MNTVMITNRNHRNPTKKFDAKCSCGAFFRVHADPKGAVAQSFPNGLLVTSDHEFIALMEPNHYACQGCGTVYSLHSGLNSTCDCK